MFKSSLDENLKADELIQGEDEGLCYEIVKSEEEKPLTLEEARRLVEKNYFLNKEELTKRFDDLFGSDSDVLLGQYVNSKTEFAEDSMVTYNAGNQSDHDCSTEDECPQYIGRGYGLLGAQVALPVEEMDEEVMLEDSDEISSTINVNQRAGRGQPMPMTNYGKGPPPFWSNVFADDSDED